jgi:hypothetical protein
MAPRKANDETAQAAEQIYALAKADADQQLAEMKNEIESVRIESQAAGVLQALQATSAYGELLKAITLHRIKQNKEYKAGGMTWDGFCESQGLERRTVDRMLDDLGPIIDTFSDSIVRFSGMPFSKIRLLGRQISGHLSEIKDNCLIYGDEEIPLTPDHRDDIQALIERIGEEARAVKDEAESTIRTKDRLLKGKEEVIKKQEKDLARFEREVKARGLTPEEASLLDKISAMEVVFNGHCQQMDTLIKSLRETPATDAVAATIAMLDSVRMKVNVYRDEVVVNLAPSGMLPDEEWQPPIAR